MIEQVVAHKVNVTLIARIVETGVLVEVYGLYLLVTRAVLFVVADHILVKSDRSGAGSESEVASGLDLRLPPLLQTLSRSFRR